MILGKMQVTLKFAIGQLVYVDGPRGIKGYVTTIEIRMPNLLRYEVSWFDNDDAKFVVFDEWRLSVVEP